MPYAGLDDNALARERAKNFVCIVAVEARGMAGGPGFEVFAEYIIFFNILYFMKLPWWYTLVVHVSASRISQSPDLEAGSRPTALEILTIY